MNETCKWGRNKVSREKEEKETNNCTASVIIWVKAAQGWGNRDIFISFIIYIIILLYSVGIILSILIIITHISFPTQFLLPNANLWAEKELLWPKPC